MLLNSHPEYSFSCLTLDRGYVSIVEPLEEEEEEGKNQPAWQTQW
jgi:hypothetical protein